MAINERLIDTEVAAAGNGGAAEAEEGLILHLDANDVDSYDGDGTEWVDIANHEYKPATNPSEHFNTVLYTGDGNADKDITGVGFQPDLVWIKHRDGTLHNVWFDSVRGAGKRIISNLTIAEDTGAEYGVVDSFDLDGFGLDRQSQTSLNNVNQSGENYVAWCFKAGGAPSGSDKVSIDGTSYATMTAAGLTDGTEPISKLSVNTKLGFSIVKYTAPALTGDTVAHGLGETPEMIILKSTSVARNWNVFHKDVGTSKNLHLNTADAASTGEYWTANSNTFSIQDYSASANWIAYAFTSKRGVSKVGSYTGTGAAGNKVYTGFEPAFVMLKVTNATSGWVIIDSKRNDKYLLANATAAEVSSDIVDFNSDGFTFKGNSMNGSGNSHIYLAFAKNTNETSLIPDTDLELHLDAASFPQKGETGYSNTPTTWTDSSGNNNNSTISGTTFDSELGNYLNFNAGNDYVVTPEIGDTTNFTYEIWINPTNANTAAKFIIGEQVGGQIYADNGVIKIYSNGFSRTFSGSPTLSNNIWTHIALSVSSGVATIYINGENKGTSNDTNTGITAPIYIGTATTQIGNSLYNISGKIGQVRSYSSALTQDQIRQNFNFTKNNYPNGYNGTISGATWNSSGYFNFDGSNDYVDTSLLYKENNTVSMWVNFTSNSSIQLWGAGQNSTNWIYCTIVDDQDSAHNDYTVNLWIRGGSSAYNYQNFNNVTLNSYGNWNFLTFRMEELTGANFYMSVNGGAEQQSVSYLTSGTVTSTPNDGINIGRGYTNGTWSYGNSKISKFKVHDKPLTQAEITALYNEGE